MPHHVATPLPRWLTISEEPARPDRALIDGQACRTRANLLAEFARALRLPDHFGHNWDALADCLRDVAAGPAPTIAVEHAGALLSSAPDLVTTLLEIIDGLDHGAAPGLMVTLHVPPGAAGRFAAVVTARLATGRR